MRGYQMRGCVFVGVILLAVQANAERCDVVSPAGGGGQWKGEGTLVVKHEGRGIVVTAKHVVRGATGAPQCVFKNPQVTLPAKAMTRLPNGDLQCLLVDNVPDTLRPTPLSPERPTGQVSTFRGTAQIISDRKWRSQHGRCQLEFANGHRQGDSGTGVLDSKGRLVGVLWGSDGTKSSSEVWHTTAWTIYHTCAAWDFPKSCCPVEPRGNVMVPRTPADDTPPPVPSTPSDPVTREKPPVEALDRDALVAEIVEALANDKRFKGETGPQGAPGNDGADGRDGTDGSVGPPGPRGPQGEPGQIPDGINEDLATIEQRLADIDAKLKKMDDASFRYELIWTDGSKQTGDVKAHGGLLRIDFSSAERE